MITVLGEATTPHGVHQRHLRTPDGQRWVVSAYRGRFFPEGQTLVMRADATGDFHGDDVVERPGLDMDAAQAEFERRYRAGSIPAPAKQPTPASAERASEEACQVLRAAIEAAGAGRLHIVPNPDL